MEKRKIILQTVDNMLGIYQDISQICQLIEEKMKNLGFEALGNKGIIWETSSSMDYPDSWLHNYFARAYLKKRQAKKIVGYCIHLGGYYEDDITRLKNLNLSLPVINVSVLELQKRAEEYNRYEIYNSLFNAGWYSKQQEIKANAIMQSRLLEGYVAQADAITYYLDLLALDSEDAINKLIVQPMKEMHSGKSEWVVQNNLPVQKIGG